MQIGVYGSLKKGKYNHRLIEDCELVGKTKVKGTLYRVSSYPALIEEGDNEYELEVYKITNPNVFEDLRNMEIGAGYIEIELTSPDIVGSFIVYFAGDRLEERCKTKYEVISSY